MTKLGEGGLTQLRDNFFIASLHDAVQAERERTPRQQQCDSCKGRGEEKAAERRCLNCRENMCKECVVAHQRLNLTKNHMTISYNEMTRISVNDDEVEEETNEDEGMVCCTQHPFEESKLYCEDCSAPVCIPCKLTNHSSHKCCNIETAIHVEQDSLKRLSQHLKGRLSEYEKMKAEWDEYARELESQEKSLLKKIAARREEILKAIEEWYQMLRKKARDNFWQEKHFVSSKMSTVQKQLDTYRTVLEHLSTVLTATRAKQLLGLTAQLKDELRLNHMADDDLSNLSLTMKLVSIDMLGTDSQTALSASVELLGTVQISYKKVLQNQQRFVKRLTLVNKFQTRPSTLYKCRFDASRLVINFREHLIVTDRQLERVSLFDAGGKYRGQICTASMGKPLSGAQLPNGDVVIVREKPTLCVFSPHGRDKKILKESLMRPCCVSTTPDGNFMVLDFAQKQVMKFCSNTYTKISEISTSYNKGSRWDKVIVKPNGHIFICVHKESCIYEFSPKGRQLGSYGRHGNSEPGELSCPRGMGMDPHGNLIVADSGNNCLQLVSPQGTWIYIQVSSANALQCPTDVAVTSNGMICVLESTGIIKVFQYTPF